jgi:hypothetical protein
MLRSKAGWARSLPTAVVPMAGLVLIWMLLAAPAHAQPVDRYLLDQFFPLGVPGYTEPGVTVASRLRPEYEAPGVQAGSFIIRPQVTESLGYNSNVLGTSRAKGSLDEETQASVGANSNWGRNSLGGLVSVDDHRYPSQSSQNRTDWTASVGGTYDFGRDQLALAATHISTHQLPTDLAAFPTDQPLPFTLDNIHISYSSPFARITVMPYFDYTRLNFSSAIIDGISKSQGYRDSNSYQGGVRASYEFSPGRNAVVEVRGVGIDYPTATPGVALPGSNTLAVLGGLDYTASGVWRYRALVGYQQRSYATLPSNAANQFKTRSSPIAEASVIWTPTELTSVTGRFLYTIEDPTEQSTQGYNYTSFHVIVDHEYLKNVLLRGYVGLQNADYVGVSYTETLYQIGGNVTWLLNRKVNLIFSYAFTDRMGSNTIPTTTISSTGPVPISGGNYLQNIFLVQARFKL